MPVNRSLRLLPVSRAISRACAGAVVLLGLLGLLGGAFDVAVLQRIVRGWPTMKVDTALGFVLAGLSLLACQQALRFGKSDAGAMRLVARAAATLVLLIAGAVLMQYAIEGTPGLDRLFHVHGQGTDSTVPGRMSLATTVLFLLSGIALLLFSGKPRSIGLAQACALPILLVALLVLLAYLLGADLARVGPFATMAVHTAFAFGVLALGMLALRIDEDWFSVFMQDTTSARNSRRYILATLLVLPLLAVLGVYAQRELDWYGPYFGNALLTVAGISALATLNWLATRSGNQADRKLDNMARVLGTLSGINKLIVRVRDKPMLFDEACRIATVVGRFPLAWIAIYEADGLSAHIVAAGGQGANNLSARMPRTLNLAPDNPGEDGLLRRVRDTKSRVVMNAIEIAPTLNPVQRSHRQELVDGGIRSLAAIPLMTDGKLLGALTLHAERAGFFDAGEMALLEEMAGDIAFAISHLDKEATLRQLAFYDPLTGLPNRALFMERLERQLQSAARSSGEVAVLLANLRRFRMINETFGRHAGDELLCQVATRLREGMAFPENLARLDGDTFASYMPSAGTAKDGLRLQELFARVLERPFRIANQDLVVDATLAIAVFPGDGSVGETLMANAAAALRRAQDMGERSMFYEPAMNARVADVVKLEYRLRRAVELDQLELHYQPKVDIATRKVRGVEALMRWRDPERGLVPPGQFIPLMEEIGLIGQAGTWALHQAVADLERLRTMGLPVPRCAVNVSALQLRDPGFVRTVLNAVAGFGDDEVMLDIEITESLIMQDVPQTIRVLQTLRGVGMQVAIDDFGTGYSSLAYLAQLPINALKVDRAFVLGLDAGPQGVMIVQSIISMAHALRLQVVAEGVETEEQALQLQSMGCSLMQGYLYSKPVPFAQLTALLAQAG